MGNACCTVETKRTFTWRIQGFSALQETFYESRPFEFGGYIWTLMMYPKIFDEKSGKECIGLFLKLEDASSLPCNLVVETAFVLCVPDQLHNKHIKREDSSCCFGNKKNIRGYHNIISLETFKNSTKGYLLNDCCNLSVTFVKLRNRIIDCRDTFECLTIQGKPASQLFTWKIENFSDLQGPETSGKFVIDGQKWNLKLYPDGKKKNNCLGIFLELVTPSAVPFKSELYVEFSFSLLDQINGKHKKFAAKKRFDEDAPTHGLDGFMSLRDFHDPSEGFLLKNACIIEASVMVLGSSSRP